VKITSCLFDPFVTFHNSSIFHPEDAGDDDDNNNHLAEGSSKEHVVVCLDIIHASAVTTIFFRSWC
jgi:hypothetical protein